MLGTESNKTHKCGRSYLTLLLRVYFYVSCFSYPVLFCYSKVILCVFETKMLLSSSLSITSTLLVLEKAHERGWKKEKQQEAWIPNLAQHFLVSEHIYNLRRNWGKRDYSFLKKVRWIPAWGCLFAFWFVTRIPTTTYLRKISRLESYGLCLLDGTHESVFR